MFIKFVRSLLKKLPKIGVRKSGLLFTRDNIRIDYEFEYYDKGIFVYIEVWFDPEKKFHIKLYDDDTVNVYAYLPPNSNDVKLTYIIHRGDGRVEDEQTYDALTQDEKVLIWELANEVSLAETAMTIDAYCEYCREYEEDELPLDEYVGNAESYVYRGDPKALNQFITGQFSQTDIYQTGEWKFPAGTFKRTNGGPC